MICFFFFKQKTAYEVRISDWSSDVCSSDLRSVQRAVPLPLGPDRRVSQAALCAQPSHRTLLAGAARFRACSAATGGDAGAVARPAAVRLGLSARRRSEEHTSELQSLMRISYAVFCLKKKNTNSDTTPPKPNTVHTQSLLPNEKRDTKPYNENVINRRL